MVAQAAADTIRHLLNVESLSAENRTAAGIASGDTSGRAAIATGPNPNFHPADDQLVQEFIFSVENGLDPRFMTVPRSALEAVVRRLSLVAHSEF